jgi:hypothetical protein
MATVLDAPVTPQKKKSNSPSPSAITRFRAMTKKVVVPFIGAAARQNPGTGAEYDELSLRPNSDDFVPATPTPHGNVRRLRKSEDPFHRLQNVPTIATNDADLARQSIHQKPVKIFSSVDFSTTAGRNLSILGRDLSASQGLQNASQFGQPADDFRFTFKSTPKSANSSNSANSEPISITPKTRKKSKGVSEVVVPVSHASGVLQGRQISGFPSESQISANSPWLPVSPEQPTVSTTFPLPPPAYFQKRQSLSPQPDSWRPSRTAWHRYAKGVWTSSTYPFQTGSSYAIWFTGTV